MGWIIVGDFTITSIDGCHIFLIESNVDYNSEKYILQNFFGFDLIFIFYCGI